jgi:RES domain-containing protein
MTAIERLDDLVEPFSGSVFCHVPGDRPFAHAELARPDDAHDRWGTSGCRTVFLASDPAIAVAEYARHRPPNAPADDRRLVGMRLVAVMTIDLRRPACVERLTAGAPRGRLVDRETARAIAATARRTATCQGLIVPSMAFLDRPERFNVVLFAENLGRDLSDLLLDVHDVGRVTISGR